MLSLDMCNQLETKTVGDQLEAVRGEHNHAPKEKVKATGAEGLEIKERMSARQVSIWCTTISDAIGHLMDFSYKQVTKKVSE